MIKNFLILVGSICFFSVGYAAIPSMTANTLPISGQASNAVVQNPAVETNQPIELIQGQPAATDQNSINMTDLSVISTPDKGTPAVQAPVQTTSPIVMGQPYSILQLINLGYSIEIKAFSQGETVSGAIAKSAIWKIRGTTEEFWQGVVNSKGEIILKHSLTAPENPQVLSTNWTG